MIILVQDARFYAHKMLLAMCSAYFRTQFFSRHWSMQQQAYCNPQIVLSDAAAKDNSRTDNEGKLLAAYTAATKKNDMSRREVKLMRKFKEAPQ